jgi:hypothetical protein
VRISTQWSPRFCVRATFQGGPNKNSEGLENYAFLLLQRTRVLSMSFSLLAVPWTKHFGCEVTFLGLLKFQASHWLKFCSSWPLTSGAKRALVSSTLFNFAFGKKKNMARASILSYQIKMRNNFFVSLGD